MATLNSGNTMLSALKKNQEERNDIISLNYDSFDFNIVVENFHGLGVDNPVTTVMFPDWRHLVMK